MANNHSNMAAQSISEIKGGYFNLLNAAWENIPYIKGYRAHYMILFLAVVDSINRQRWNPVRLPLDYLLNKTASSRKVYTDARKWLSENGLLSFKPGKNANQMAEFDLGPVVYNWAANLDRGVQKWTGMDTGRSTSHADSPADKCTGTDTHLKTETSTNNIHKPINVLFEVFWDLYDKKVGRIESQKLWEQLTDEERNTAVVHISKYKQSQPQKEFRLGPSRYLMEKRFNDEIISNSKYANNNISQQLKKDKNANEYKAFLARTP